MADRQEEIRKKAQAELERRKSHAPNDPIDNNNPNDITSRAQFELDKRRTSQSNTPANPPEEDEEGFWTNLLQGGKYGKQDVERQMKIINQLRTGEIPEPIGVQEAPELGFDRKSIGQFIGRTATGAGPAFGAGLGGAKIGALVGAPAGPIGATIGAITGGTVGGGSIGASQAFADAYNEARLAGFTHEDSIERGKDVAKISGITSLVAAPLGAVGVKDAFIKQAVKQLPIQAGVANVENIARNIEAKESGVAPEREILAGAAEATFGPALVHTAQAAGTKAAIGSKNLVKGSSNIIKPVIESTPPSSQVTKPHYKYNPETKAWNEVKPITSKPRYTLDQESGKWIPIEEKTNTVISTDETNLGRKPGVTEQEKNNVDVNTDTIHQKIFGNQDKEKTPTFLGKIIDKAKNIYKENLGQQEMFDAHAPIKRLESLSGTKSAGEGTAYRGARFARNVSGVLKAAYDYGRPYWDKSMQIMRVNKDAPGLTTIFKSVAKSKQMLNDFQTYAYSRRVKANKLIEQGKEQNIKPHEVDAAIGLEDKYGNFRQAFDEIQEYNKAILDILEDTGMINADKRATWEEMDYVPFHRVLSEELGISPTPIAKSNKLVGQKAKIKALKGKKEMWQVTDNDGKEIGRYPAKKEAEGAAQKFNATPVEENVGHQTSNILENLYRNVSSFLPAAMKNAAAVDTLHKAVQAGAAEKVTPKKSVNALGNKLPNVVTVMENGKPVNYRVTDPKMYKAVTESYGSTKQRGPFGSLMKGVKSVFSAAIISNPKVALGIAAKDILQSGIVGKYNMNNIKGLVYDLPKELVKAYAHEFGIKFDPRQADIAAMGAESRYAAISPEARMRQMERLIEKNNGKILPYAKDKLATVIDSIITPAENANRMRKFEAARKAGKDIATAGYESLDYMDYGKKGTSGFVQFLRDFVPFAGSHLSSTHTLGTELAHKGGFNRTTRNLLILNAFSGANAIHNLDDTNDPDPANGYMSLPDYIRDNNWCIDTYKFSNGKERFKNEDARWIMIPKSWEAGQLGGSVIENSLAYYKGEEDGKDILNYLRKQFMDYLTINPAGAPVVKTAIEQFANKQFFMNAPIVPRQTEGLEPSLQYSPRTSETAKRVGAATNVSPARIEHAAKGILGSIADYTFMLGDIMINDKSKGEEPDKKTSDKYIFNKFIKGTPLERTSYENEMYELYHDTQKTYKTLKQLRKLDPAAAMKYGEEHTDLLSKRGFAEARRKQLKEINDQMDLVRNNKKLTGQQKQKSLDKLTNEKNKMLYQMHKQLKEEKKK